ncbi:ATP-binding cassette domain-containing protein [Mangrovitalea sediminis]|uniref:ATP-binding cassette domain-containing protein n=1 Tax=Mangrovitalea sediminis TaxID=1982043 RepID=UPI000BE56F6F|nr:ATP-binding cassette domain-containing protein [Mangrovitalea sediminis]
MLTFNDISLQRGGQWLLESGSAVIQPGQRVAVVGANGAGKSSLFQVVLGHLPLDKGEVSLPGGCRIAHMAQEVAASDRSARDFVLDGHHVLRRLEAELAAAEARSDDHAVARVHGELETLQAWDAARRAESLLRGLGFSDEQMSRPVQAFSGGWRIRLNLAQALMMPSDLLLLDEPTNHLDLDACFWLEGWLRSYPGTLLFISHDRDFMDRVATHVLHFDQRRLDLYTGNYSSFERQRRERMAQQQAQYEQQQERIAEIQRFVARFKAKATKARQAQSRLKALARMEEIAPAHIDSPFRFRFPVSPKISNPLLSIRDGEVGYGETAILQHLKLTLLPGSRIGLLGPNGAGKSTLIDVLRGALPLRHGQRVAGEHLSCGHFAQHQLEALDLDASPVLHLQRLTPDASEQSMRNFLGGFGFPGEVALGGIRHFSGGEKARLALAIVAWQKPNLLLLDEPTNHLDLEMRQALTVALQDFEGAMVVVSHDRHLLRNTVDEFWRVSDGAVAPFDGDLDDYERWLAEQRQSAGDRNRTESLADNSERKEDRKLQRKLEAELRQRLSPLKRELDQLENTLEGLQSRLADIEEALGDSGLYEVEQKSRLQALLQEQTDCRRAVAEAEQRWLEVGERYEQMQAEGLSA